ncbi:Chromatin modification-related protein EAF3 [Phytophthora palmivora]|uniref:Chromatin modification-related protein EAF3 n=1 Tax=Phytophthora palmivora TaxID=4796 RepID=A0A2P4X8N4_9STRA|nr:Chromatin modification-related protein EAF3 [Phytophthora palmivora]
MVFKIGDAVLVYYDLLIFDAEVLKIEEGDADSNGKKYFVHFSGWSDSWDEWIEARNVLEDTPINRERQKKAKEELLLANSTGNSVQSPRPMQDTAASKRPSTLPTLPGSERLVSMICWMKTLDDSLTKLDKQVKDLVRQHISDEVGTVELKKRKAEAEVQKAEFEVEVARDLKRVKIAEETAMARKRLKDAGISQEEIDKILPAAR